MRDFNDKGHSLTRLNILIITSEFPSHIYATVKLAKSCAQRGHQVTFAAPGTETLAKIILLTKGFPIYCVQVGSNKKITHNVNERYAKDPYSWETFIRSLQNPFPMAQGLTETLCKPQEGMYEPIKKMLFHGNFNIALPVHSVATTVCDAVESLGHQVDTQVMIFNSLPYDPGMHENLSTNWNTCIPALPHVVGYTQTKQSFSNPLTLFSQFFWQMVDATIRYYAYVNAGQVINNIRKGRGLKPVPCGFLSYFQRYPAITFGGLDLFTDDRSMNTTPSRVTPIGLLDMDGASPELSPSLQGFVYGATQGIIYIGFGTGVVMTETEATKIAQDLVRTVQRRKPGVRILLSLRPSEQQRLTKIFEQAIGFAPTSKSSSHLEYLHGVLRIESHVPQASLLKSGRVRIFFSHMGMGGFTEGVVAGVPFACYPSGCDQFYNTERAISAGIGVRVPCGMDGVGSIIVDAMDSESMFSAAHEASRRVRALNGSKRAMDAIERYASLSTKGAY